MNKTGYSLWQRFIFKPQRDEIGRLEREIADLKDKLKRMIEEFGAKP